MSRFETAFEIGGRRVGPAEPAYVIAEVGANHNRDLEIARQLVDVAADAGADAVKFQTYTGKDIYSSRTPRFTYLDDERSPQELLDAIALPREWQPELAKHASSRGIAFFSSPFDHAAVDGLRPHSHAIWRGFDDGRSSDTRMQTRFIKFYRGGVVQRNECIVADNAVTAFDVGS